MTPQELSTKSFGYLTGADLIQWSSVQLLIKQGEVLPESLQNGCSIAYSEAINLFRTKYDVVSELNMISGSREVTFVKLVAILAVRNILGNMAGVNDTTKMNFDWATETIHQIQSGLFSLGLKGANRCIRSGSILVQSNFSLLG